MRRLACSIALAALPIAVLFDPCALAQQGEYSASMTPSFWANPHPAGGATYQTVAADVSTGDVSRDGHQSTIRLLVFSNRPEAPTQGVLFAAALPEPCYSPVWTPAEVWKNSQPLGNFEVGYGLKCSNNTHTAFTIYTIRFRDTPGASEMVSVLDSITIADASDGHGGNWSAAPLSVNPSRSNPFFETVWAMTFGGQVRQLRIWNVPGAKMITVL